MPSVPERAEIPIADETALGGFAKALAATLPDQAFVALYGDLGAGKTTLVKAVAAAVGIDPVAVVSPTFGLIHEHTAAGCSRDLRLVHADLYRLGGVAELRETGWDDCVAARPGQVVWVFVEWPERMAAALPADRLDIVITIVSETARTLALTSRGPAHDRVIRGLHGRESLSSPQ